MNDLKKLTDKSYWDEIYRRGHEPLPLKINGFRNRSNRLIFEKLREIDLNNKKILEIGAGDSSWLPFLAQQFPLSRFAGIDYSESGCSLLSERARIAGVDVQVIQEDIFVEHSKFHGSFDVIYSLGVVEHFDDLSKALSAKRKYLAPEGKVFTLIPNMAGLVGALARSWNRSVYDKHNPHDWESFAQGHCRSGLTVMSGGYLEVANFGVLSACFPSRQGLAFQINRALVATSLAIGWVEDNVGNLPVSRSLSPYIYATSY